ncbi:VanZ family protein [Sedimentisphaera salicampi]|uniref:Putative integral membrane protein n=1 Tax=Sedimentisphaera salicampi TaxID=1941349 RepID=A0A1W6LJA4_9BACT|nr:VanZ family protein [Sedimentisphaera salicampi]ARN55861.1 putative integral membrane protein [Sedimentisphaera salicampi]OXU16052.1 putative integral membrane protein [Sedimentisphaera salicampi]
MLLKIQYQAVVLSVILTIVVFFLTHIPAGWLPDAANYNDKMIHFAAYFLLAFLYNLSFSAASWKSVLISFAIIIVLAGVGFLDEYTQQFFGREYCMADYYADLKGIVSGTFAAKALKVLYYLTIGKIRLILSN